MNDKLSQLLAEQYPEEKEKYDVEKVQEEMERLVKEQSVDKPFDTN